MQLPVNRPYAAKVHNYSRDGAIRVDGSYGREKNYEPNSFGGRYGQGSRCGHRSKSLRTLIAFDGRPCEVASACGARVSRTLLAFDHHSCAIPCDLENRTGGRWDQ
jgi:hypothetical protein